MVKVIINQDKTAHFSRWNFSDHEIHLSEMNNKVGEERERGKGPNPPTTANDT